ncbi:MAG: DUF805 domain-containing protein [Bauldia sp.]|nr:DUF805 domain-containing protein [Bauldia sp.]
MQLAYVLSSPQGRITRDEFWAGFAALALFGLGAAAVVLATIGATVAGRIVLLLVLLLLLYPWFAVFAKRYQDRGRPARRAVYAVAVGVIVAVLWIVGVFQPAVSGWLLVAATVAVVAWYVIELGVPRGTVGDNAYGPDLLAR